MEHGEKYQDENGQEFMNDNVNGTDWHIPDRDKEVVNKDGSWNDKWED